MLSQNLTPHDLNVLEKIRDPESAPSIPLLIDASLPRDPHVTDTIEYEKVVAVEAQIIKDIQALEVRIATSNANSSDFVHTKQLEDYNTCIDKLANLITVHPTYASAHNNRAQALRRKYGESILVKTPYPMPSLAGQTSIEDSTIAIAANTVLYDLNTAIKLLTPHTPFASISPQAARTLSQAHTQRGALYHITAKQMLLDQSVSLRVESCWTALNLEEMASWDFVMGGRYGNELAKCLAVATNPTAKLCGSIVREAMRKEFEELAQ